MIFCFELCSSLSKLLLRTLYSLMFLFFFSFSWSSNRTMTHFIGNLEITSLLQEDKLQARKTQSLGKLCALWYKSKLSSGHHRVGFGGGSSVHTDTNSAPLIHPNNSIVSSGLLPLFFTGSKDSVYTLVCLTNPLCLGTP